MKISYILQLKDFSIMLIIGLLLGVVYGILKMPNRIKKLYILEIISDIIFVILSTTICIFAINKINYGSIRLFLLLGYIIGFIIERITLGKLFAKGFIWVYNKSIKNINKFKTTSLGRIFFK